MVSRRTPIDGSGEATRVPAESAPSWSPPSAPPGPQLGSHRRAPAEPFPLFLRRTHAHGDRSTVWGDLGCLTSLPPDRQHVCTRCTRSFSSLPRSPHGCHRGRP